MTTHFTARRWQKLRKSSLYVLCLVTGILCTGASAVAAENSSVSLDLNEDALRLSWAQLNPVRKFRYDVSLLHDQDRGSVLSGGFHIIGNAATPERPINAGLGGRLIFAKRDNFQLLSNSITTDPNVLVELPSIGNNGYALAVGGFFDAKLPNYDRVGFGGHVYFAPDVLAFGDISKYSDLWLYASYSILKNGDLYLGVRNVKAQYDVGGDSTFDTGFHAGITLKF